MAIGQIQVGDTGTLFSIAVEDQAGLPIDLTNATITFVFQKPDGTLLTVAGTPAVGGKAQYTTRSADLDQAGSWRYQIAVVSGGDSFRTDVGKFKVYPNLPI